MIVFMALILRRAAVVIRTVRVHCIQ